MECISESFEIDEQATANLLQFEATHASDMNEVLPTASSTSTMNVPNVSNNTNTTSTLWHQSPRIQSMLLRNDGSIILCNDDATDIVDQNDNNGGKMEQSTYKIEVVEIVPPNFMRTPSVNDVIAQSQQHQQQQQDPRFDNRIILFSSNFNNVCVIKGCVSQCSL